MQRQRGFGLGGEKWFLRISGSVSLVLVRGKLNEKLPKLMVRFHVNGESIREIF